MPRYRFTTSARGRPTRGSCIITITDKNAPGAKEATLALFKKKWGEPKVKKSYKEQLIFHAKAPAITISRDAMDAGWEVVVSPKPDEF